MYKGTPTSGGRCESLIKRGSRERSCAGLATREIGAMNMCEWHAERMLLAISEQVKTDPGMRAWLHSTLGVPMKAPASAAASGRELQSGLAELGNRVSVPKSFVYFMEREGLVKIGVTKNVDKRVREVSRGSAMPKGMTVGPVRLLGTIPGAYDEERALHKKFWRYRVGGEWFTYERQVKEHIDQLLEDTRTS